MKETISKELCSPDSKCRVVFVTMALGMGFNIPSVREVIHISLPRSVREYFQEAVRAEETINSLMLSFTMITMT